MFVRLQEPELLEPPNVVGRARDERCEFLRRNALHGLEANDPRVRGRRARA